MLGHLEPYWKPINLGSHDSRVGLVFGIRIYLLILVIGIPSLETSNLPTPAFFSCLPTENARASNVPYVDCWAPEIQSPAWA